MQVTRGSFGAELPAAARTIRIEFASDSGQRCCLAVDPAQLPTDPVSGRPFLVLGDVPGGGAAVTLAAFAVDFAPTDTAADSCRTEPLGVGQPCDTSRLATPTFLSDPHRVNIVSGIENNAGDIPVFAVPFLLNLSPGVDSSVITPVSITFTVADAAAGVDGQSVAVEVAQDGQSTGNAALTLTPCDDAGSTLCSAGGQLGVTGFQVTRTAQTLQPGSAQLRIQARNQAADPRGVDFAYQFGIRDVPLVTTPTGTVLRTPTATPVPGVVIVRPGGSIADAARAAPPGSLVVVAPGVYAPVALRSGDLRGPITVLADVSGSITNSPGAQVVITVRGGVPGIDLSGQSEVTLDGLTVRGGSGAGVRVRNSAGITVRHCTVTDTRGDGVLVKESSGAFVFDNLIFENSGSGVRLEGAADVRVITNTLYRNQDAGVVVGDAVQPSSGVVVKNNIMNQNTPAGVAVDPSTTGYDGDFNLNTDGYGAGTPAGDHDITGDAANPLFIAPSREDFHLQRGLAGSVSPALDSGDPLIEEDIADALGARTTQSDGSVDVPPFDLGYHYPPLPPTPTPRPQPTRTPTPPPTATATVRR